MKQMTTLAIATLLAIGLSAAPAFAGNHNMCNPCAANPCAANPCAMKHNPCEMKSHNPCNPCDMKGHSKH